MSLRSAAWPAACLAAVLVVSGCGSGPDGAAVDPAASRPAAASARVDEPGAATSGGGGAAACAAAQRPAGRDYAVSQVLPGDSDGGLLVLDAPGEGGVQLAILAGGAPVTAGDDRNACAVVGAGVWWRIRSADGVQGWVDSGGLSPRG